MLTDKQCPPLNTILLLPYHQKLAQIFDVNGAPGPALSPLPPQAWLAGSRTYLMACKKSQGLLSGGGESNTSCASLGAHGRHEFVP